MRQSLYPWVLDIDELGIAGGGEDVELEHAGALEQALEVGGVVDRALDAGAGQPFAGGDVLVDRGDARGKSALAALVSAIALSRAVFCASSLLARGPRR